MLLAMKELMVKSGMTDEGASKRKQGKNDLNLSESDTTIYQNALQKIDCETEQIIDPEISFKVKDTQIDDKRESSSWDKRVDTSDDMLDIANVHDQFIADCKREAHKRRNSHSIAEFKKDDCQLQDNQVSAKRKSEDMIWQVETSKARILATPGNYSANYSPFNRYNGGTAMQHSSLVDENYLVIGGNVDAGLCEKIIKGEYIDFAKLLPQQRSTYASDETKLELINKGGQTFFVPVNRDQGNGITSFNKWEQVFRVYSNIYSKEFPDRAAELIQYNHVIFTAAGTYVWENVYSYDRDFRTHLS